MQELEDLLTTLSIRAVAYGQANKARDYAYNRYEEVRKKSLESCEKYQEAFNALLSSKLIYNVVPLELNVDPIDPVPENYCHACKKGYSSKVSLNRHLKHGKKHK